MRMLVALVLVLAACCLLSAAAIGSAGKRVFYLTTHPRECLVSTSSKYPLLVPCSSPRHDLEVYAVGHGGWGRHGPPSYRIALGIARSVCVSAFQRVSGRALAANEGWNASWPDPGPESARYGDKIICSYRAWPRLVALGSGWHVHS